MTRQQTIDSLIGELDKAKDFLEKETEILKDIFDDNYFNKVKGQLEALVEDRAALIHPVYNLIIQRDVGHNFKKIGRMERYLVSMWNQISIKKRNHIKAQLKSFDQAQSITRVYEINVLGYLKEIFRDNNVILYPKTKTDSELEAKVKLVEREINIEVTVLCDGKFHQNKLTELLRNSSDAFFSVGTGDIQKDTNRVLSRISEKSEQFEPAKPNVLMFFDRTCWSVYPVRWPIGDDSVESIKFLKNIGALMHFDGDKLLDVESNICDADCRLSVKEIGALKDIFDSKFETLTYSASES